MRDAGFDSQQIVLMLHRANYQRLIIPNEDEYSEPGEIKYGRTELHKLVVRDGTCDKINRLVMEADVDAADEAGVTPLMLAAATGRFSRVFPILKANARINATDGLAGATALAHAAFGMSYSVVAVLLAAGADPHVPLATHTEGFTSTLLDMFMLGRGEDEDDDDVREKIVWLLKGEAQDSQRVHGEDARQQLSLKARRWVRSAMAQASELVRGVMEGTEDVCQWEAEERMIEAGRWQDPPTGKEEL